MEFANSAQNLLQVPPEIVKDPQIGPHYWLILLKVIFLKIIT